MLGNDTTARQEPQQQNMFCAAFAPLENFSSAMVVLLTVVRVVTRAVQF